MPAVAMPPAMLKAGVDQIALELVAAVAAIDERFGSHHRRAAATSDECRSQDWRTSPAVVIVSATPAVTLATVPAALA